jgi:hypothetical protein
MNLGWLDFSKQMTLSEASNFLEKYSREKKETLKIGSDNYNKNMELINAIDRVLEAFE